MNRTTTIIAIASILFAFNEASAAPKSGGADPGGHLKKADELAHQGQFDAAIAEMNKAIEAKASANNYTNRGNIYRAAQKLQEAIADYTKAIELDPKDAVAYFEARPDPGNAEAVRSCIGRS